MPGLFLGTKIAKFTKKLGVKPCAGCKKRARLLDELSRRGFIGGSVAAFLLLKNATLRSAWQAAGATIPTSVAEAMGFLRMAGTVQRHWYAENGTHIGQDDMFVEILKHKEHFSPKSAGYAWMSRLNIFSKEILPGWTLDFAVVNKGYPRALGQEMNANGYRIILRGEKYCLIEDETTICRAFTPENTPSATSLENADSFPAAVRTGLGWAEPVSAWQRFNDFLVPTVYADLCLGGCCASQTCCSQCGCTNCALNCCSITLCSGSTPPPGRCWFFMGCNGGAYDCTYYAAGCGSTVCCQCASLMGTCCQASSQCRANPQCPGGC